MRLNEFIEGLTIFSRYYDKPEGHHIAAEHDQVYVYATNKPLSEDDEKRVRALGWFQPDHEEEDPYAPEDRWSAFV